MAKQSFFQFLKGLFSGKSLEDLKSEGILIFSEGKNYWFTFKPVVEALIERNFPFTYLSIDPDDPGLRLDAPCMRQHYLGSGAMACGKMAYCQAPLMLATTPNIGNKGFPVARPKGVDCLAHIFHCVSDLSFYRKGSLDFYDAALLVGDFALQGIRTIERLRGLKEKECISLGLPYLDVLADQAETLPAAADKTGKTILLAPSWGEKGFLSAYNPDFTGHLAQSDFDFIVRPHPQSLISEKALLKKLQADLASCANVTFDFAMDGTASMAKADILISDSSSIRFDYAFIYERPVVTLEIPDRNMSAYECADMGERWDHALEREIGAVIAYRQWDPADLASEVLKQIEANLSFTPDISEIRGRYIANFKRSGLEIAKWAIDKCTAKDGLKT